MEKLECSCCHKRKDPAQMRFFPRGSFIIKGHESENLIACLFCRRILGVEWEGVEIRELKDACPSEMFYIRQQGLDKIPEKPNYKRDMIFGLLLIIPIVVLLTVNYFGVSIDSSWSSWVRNIFAGLGIYGIIIAIFNFIKMRGGRVRNSLVGEK